MKCQQCQREFADKFPDVQYHKWLQLYYYFQHELSEAEITEATYEQMIDYLMSIKSTLLAEKEETPNV
jgi:hypothetical protein